MSGTFPSSPAFNSLSVTSKQPTLVSRSISGRRQARQIGGQYWEMTATFSPMTRAQFNPILAFVIKQRGSYDTFTLVPPVISTGQGTPTGTPLVNGASQTGRTLITDGWTNDTLIFKAGDYLKLSGHDKVYMVTADVQSNSSGQTTSSGTSQLSIEPALVSSPADNEAITHTSVPFTVALIGSEQEYSTGTNGLFGYEVDFQEVF